MKLFCYVVDHNTGLAPNPNNRVCTLVYCKYKRAGVQKRNVVELACKDDWIVGIGGKSKKSCGRGKIVYVMRVDEKLSFGDYRHRFPRRLHRNGHGEFALVSRTFLYFGKDAIGIDKIPGAREAQLEKTGRGFRNDFEHGFVRRLARWVEKQRPMGKIGEPCSPRPDGSAEIPCRCRKRQ